MAKGDFRPTIFGGLETSEVQALLDRTSGGPNIEVLAGLAIAFIKADLTRELANRAEAAAYERDRLANADASAAGAGAQSGGAGAPGAGQQGGVAGTIGGPAGACGASGPVTTGDAT